MAGNPWAADTWNVTEQGQVAQRYGVDAALRMAKLAGLKKLGDTHKRAQTAKVYILQGKRGPKGDPGSGGSSSGTHEFLGALLLGTFTDAQLFTMASTPRDVTFPTTSGDESRASCRVAPTSDASFYLVADAAEFIDDGSTLICTVTFPAGELTGNLVYGSPVSVPVDAATFIVCPLTADPTITDVQIVFCGDPG